MSLQPERVKVEVKDEEEQWPCRVKREPALAPDLLHAPDVTWPRGSGPASGSTAATCSVKQEPVDGGHSDECPEIRTEISFRANSCELKLERECVKDEEEENEVEEGRYGMGEVAARAGLYAGHAVKRELVLGPELQQASHTAFAPKGSTAATCSVKQEPVDGGHSDECPEIGTEISFRANSCELKLEPECVKDEEEENEVEEGRYGMSEAAARAGLYAGHAVKRELVLGPELEQAPYTAFAPKEVKIEPHTTSQSLAGAGASGECPGERPRCSDRRGEQPELRTCVVRLERVSFDSFEKQFRGVTQVTHTRPYSCHICKKSFAQKKPLYSHLRTHTQKKAFSCDLCKKQFVSNSKLIVHKRIHTGEKPYSCDVCNKQFAQLANFITHKRIHTGEKSYSCGVCNKRYAHLATLKNHKRIHTGEKPFSCDVCNKQFAQLTTFKIHKRIHTGEKPWLCVVCNKQFVQLANFIRHKRIHAGEK